MTGSGTLRLSGDPALRPAAQRALIRILETTIPDRGTWERALARATAEAKLEQLPETFDAMVEFARRHLAKHLDDGGRPWLVGAVLEDLEAEAEVERLGGDANSSARMAVATRIPSRLPNTAPAPAGADEAMQAIPKAPPMPTISPASSDPPSTPSSSKMNVAPSSSKIVPASSKMAASSPLSPPSSKTQLPRLSVLVIDDDRFGRAALARALVQGRCDVTVLDGVDDAAPVLEGTDPIDAVLLDVDTPGSQDILTTLVRFRPEVPVLFWTSSPPAVAEHVARVAGVRAVAVLPRTARNAELNETLRRLVVT